jgi:hypothetical protein
MTRLSSIFVIIGALLLSSVSTVSAQLTPPNNPDPLTDTPTEDPDAPTEQPVEPTFDFNAEGTDDYVPEELFTDDAASAFIYKEGETDDEFEIPNRGKDCKTKGIRTSYDCDIYHRGALLENGTRTTIGPSIDVIPTRNSSTPKSVKVAIKFNDFNSADSLAGNNMQTHRVDSIAYP